MTHASPFLIVAVAMLLGLCPGRAVGQGTMGMFPDPISTVELTRLLDRYVGTRPDQWTAIEPALVAYQTQFSALREGEIETALEAMRNMQGTVPSIASVEAYMSRADRATARIRTLDERLFDEIAVALDEAQLGSLGRARQARERRRHLSASAQMWLGGSPTIDLSQLVLEMDLDAERRRAADTVLISYEPTLTRATAALEKAGSTMMLEMVEALEAGGFAGLTQEEMLANPERMQMAMEVMQNAMAAITKKSAEANRAVRTLNHRTRRQLVDALGPEAGRRFAQSFLRSAYPSIVAVAVGEGRAEAARRVRNLSESQREAIEMAVTRYRSADDRVVEELIKALDQHADTANPMMGVDPETSEAHANRLGELGAQRDRLVDELVRNLEAIVGADALRQGEESANQDALAADATGAAEGAADADEGAVQRPRSSGDLHVLGPISVQEVAAWAGRMSLDSGRRALLDELHTDYLEDWQTTVAPLITAISEALVSSVTATDSALIITREKVELAASRRSAATAAATLADERFFRNATDAIAVGDEVDRFELFALWRELCPPQSTEFGAFGFAGIDSNQESSANLVGVLVDGLDEITLLTIVERVLLDHADELRAAQRTMVEALMQSQRTFSLVGADYSEAAGNPEKLAEITARTQKMMSESSRRSDEARKARRAVNRRVLDDLRNVLPPERVEALDSAYRRASWPSIYDDPSDPTRVIDRVLEIHDLSEEQRAKVVGHRAETAKAYTAKSEQMLAAADSTISPDFEAAESMRAWTEQVQRMERLRFERQEIAASAIRRVRAVLTDEQAARVPALANFNEQFRDRRWFEAP